MLMKMIDFRKVCLSHFKSLFLLNFAEINCWQDWLVFSDIFYFLTKSGCIDFIDFVDKLVSRLSEGDHHILRTNHVTWLLAQIIRIELVMNALNSDSRKVVNLMLNIVIFYFLFCFCFGQAKFVILSISTLLLMLREIFLFDLWNIF